MKFLADHMLGRLARWLRLLGYDTTYTNIPLDDNALVDLSQAEQRVLLTRDKNLAQRVGIPLIKSERVDQQLEQVVRDYSLSIDEGKVLSRCSVCNTLVIAIDRKETKPLVPDRVYAMHQEFWLCPSCHRCYWKGSHWDKIMRRVRLLENLTGGGVDR